MHPSQVFSQVQKSKAKEVKRSRKKADKSKDFSFQFGPGKRNIVEIPVYPKTGLFHLKITWEGSAKELKAKLISDTKYSTSEFVKVEGRSPLYLTYLFEPKEKRIKRKLLIKLENLTPNLTAKGIATIFYDKEEKVTNESGANSGYLDKTLSYKDFIKLDRHDWGRSDKEYKNNRTIQIKYANGNTILKEADQIFFMDSKKRIRYKIVKEGTIGIQIIPDAQPPGPPPNVKFFIGDAEYWRENVENWINNYNQELLDEIFELLNNDQELVDRYKGVEKNLDYKLFELTELRIQVVKDLRIIYGE